MAPPSAIDIRGVSDTQSIVVPLVLKPVTVDVVVANREKAGKMVAGVAALTSSDMYKTPVCKSI